MQKLWWGLATIVIFGGLDAQPSGVTPELRTLTPEEVQGYLEGRCMGMARVAELSGYPGPKHVLPLADSLGLTEEQKTRIRQIREAAEPRLKELGQKIVRLEQELDSLFAAQAVDTARLKTLITRIATLKGEVRFIHLSEHVQTRKVLTEEQLNRYYALRTAMAEHHHKDSQEGGGK